MLQQTQVATVLERFYHPFLEKFPTIQRLAAAPREQVMKAWEGLGYYRRAGFLHEAAKRAHNGLPRDVEGLRALPGIGRNTAHAIAAFAYRQPVAIMEANVKRIVARVFALATPTDDQLWHGAEVLLNRDEPFDYNQAMMDLGSIICTPKAPQCPACPANKLCRGQEHAESYPTPKVKKQVSTRWVDILVREDAKGRFYLEKRDDALLGGLYGFPQQASDPTKCRDTMLGTVRHVYSHFKLEGRVLHRLQTPAAHSSGWYTRQEITHLPLSKVDHKVLALMDSHSTAPKAKKPRKPRK